jgi:hypothetical protein
MAVEKKSVSIDTDLWAQLMKVAGDRPASAVLNEALRLYLWRLDVAAFVAEHEAEHGPITETERAAARAELAAAIVEAAPASAPKRRPRSAPKRVIESDLREKGLIVEKRPTGRSRSGRAAAPGQRTSA